MAGSTVAKNNILQIYLTNFNTPSWESVTEDLKVPGSTLKQEQCLKNVTNSQPTASNLHNLFSTL
jgi:hypothetical protein